MTPFEEDVLFGGLLQAMCWRDLHDPAIGGMLNAKETLALAKAAGLSEDVAQKLATQRAEARLNKNLPC